MDGKTDVEYAYNKLRYFEETKIRHHDNSPREPRRRIKQSNASMVGRFKSSNYGSERNRPSEGLNTTGKTRGNWM